MPSSYTSTGTSSTEPSSLSPSSSHRGGVSMNHHHHGHHHETTSTKRESSSSFNTSASTSTSIHISSSTKAAVLRSSQYIARRRAAEMSIHSIDTAIYKARKKNKFSKHYRNLAVQDTQFLAMKHTAERELLQMLETATTEQKLALCFRMVDLNQDEEVDAFELAKTLQLIQAETTFNDALQAARLTIMANDEGDNEVLCFAEFVKFLGSTSTFLKITIDDLAHFLIMEITSLYDGPFIINETCDKDLYLDTSSHSKVYDKMTDIEKVRMVILFELLDSCGTQLLDFRHLARVMKPISEQMDPEFRKHLFSSLPAIYNYQHNNTLQRRSCAKLETNTTMANTPEDSALDHQESSNDSNPNAMNFVQFVEFFSKVVKASPADLTLDRIANIVTTSVCEKELLHGTAIDELPPSSELPQNIIFEDVFLDDLHQRSTHRKTTRGSSQNDHHHHHHAHEDHHNNNAHHTKPKLRQKRRNSIQKSKINFSTGDLPMLHQDADGYFTLTSDMIPPEDLNKQNSSRMIHLPETLRNAQQSLRNAFNENFNEEMGYKNNKTSLSQNDIPSIPPPGGIGSSPHPSHSNLQSTNKNDANTTSTSNTGYLNRVSSKLNFGLNDELTHSTRTFNSRSIRNTRHSFTNTLHTEQLMTSHSDHAPRLDGSKLNFGLNDELAHSTRSSNSRSIKHKEEKHSKQPLTSHSGHTPRGRQGRRVTMAL